MRQRAERSPFDGLRTGILSPLIGAKPHGAAGVRSFVHTPIVVQEFGDVNPSHDL